MGEDAGWCDARPDRADATAGVHVTLAAELNTLPAGPIAGDGHVETLDRTVSAGRIDLQHERIGTAIAVGGTIEDDECRHLGGETLFEVGSFEHAALDAHRPMFRRRRQPDRRQRSRCAIGPNIDVNGNAYVFARRRFDLAHRSRMRDDAGQAEERERETISAYRKH